ncbi:hypothetical protein Pla52o_47800 [Novipirellula galeiformis]|uniref:Uncharacterized protein n=1 Tax=Novipirellula galeiformis TaxID=2528004 RepID=A0A5C6C6K7_9BACT|nr:hypothetical protein Pla52o_47800 [Novipirellula galeiformis]
MNRISCQRQSDIRRSTVNFSWAIPVASSTMPSAKSFIIALNVSVGAMQRVKLCRGSEVAQRQALCLVFTSRGQANCIGQQQTLFQAALARASRR